MTTTATEVPTIEELIPIYSDAWASHDADRIAALHAEDGIFHLHSGGAEPAEGRAAIREAFAGFLALFPDLEFTEQEMRTGRWGWSVRWTMSGTLALPYPVGERTAGPGGRIVDRRDRPDHRLQRPDRRQAHLPRLGRRTRTARPLVTPADTVRSADPAAPGREAEEAGGTLGTRSAEAFVAGFAEGWRAPRDADSFADFFEPLLAPDVRLVQPQVPTTIGREAFREQFARPSSS